MDLKRYTILGIIVFVLILLGGILSITQNQREVQNLQTPKTQLILGNEIIDDVGSILVEDENIYLSIEFIEKYFDSSIRLSEDGKRVFIDLSDKDFEMEDEGLTDFVKERSMGINIPVKIKDYTKYLPVNHLGTIFSIDVSYNEDSDIVIIDRFTDEIMVGSIKNDNTVLYPDKSVKSDTIHTSLFDEICKTLVFHFKGR